MAKVNENSTEDLKMTSSRLEAVMEAQRTLNNSATTTDSSVNATGSRKVNVFCQKYDPSMLLERLLQPKTVKMCKNAKTKTHITSTDARGKMFKDKQNCQLLQRSKPLKRKLLSGNQLDGVTKKMKMTAAKVEEQSRPTRLTIQRNPWMMHTINLLRYKNDFERQFVENGSGSPFQLKIPQMKNPTRVANFSYDVKLNNREVQQILNDATAFMLLNGGFTHAHARPWEVLTDYLGNFLKQMAFRLKDVQEMQMTGASCGFPDAMEHVLVEMGFGGARSLQTFYEKEVIKRAQSLERRYVMQTHLFIQHVRNRHKKQNDKPKSN